MTPPELAALIPRSKHDLEIVQSAVALGFTEIEPIVPALLKWLQDANWPVAHVLAPFFASVGAPMAPYIRDILKTDDDTWKYFLVQTVVGQSRELCQALERELRQIVVHPTDGERFEEVNRVSIEALELLKSTGASAPEAIPGKI